MLLGLPVAPPNGPESAPASSRPPVSSFGEPPSSEPLRASLVQPVGPPKTPPPRRARRHQSGPVSVPPERAAPEHEAFELHRTVSSSPPPSEGAGWYEPSPIREVAASAVDGVDDASHVRDASQLMLPPPPDPRDLAPLSSAVRLDEGSAAATTAVRPSARSWSESAAAPASRPSATSWSESAAAPASVRSRGPFPDVVVAAGVSPPSSPAPPQVELGWSSPSVPEPQWSTTPSGSGTSGWLMVPLVALAVVGAFAIAAVALGWVGQIAW